MQNNSLKPYLRCAMSDFLNSTEVPLTGDRPTGELAKITKNEAVTVAVARGVKPGMEAEFNAWAGRMLRASASFDGYLGGGVLGPAIEGGEHHVIVKFRDAQSLRKWERSAERAGLLAEANCMISSSRAAAIVGPGTLVEVAENISPDRKLPVAVASDTLWILPIAVGAGTLLAPALGGLHYLLRTAIVTTAITLSAHLILNPVRRRVHRRRRAL